jgi:ubiquitin carboxyl-terminal hydrolase 2/21
MDLSVQIPSKGLGFGSVELEDCLYDFIEAEKMEECGYKCQNKKCQVVDRMQKDMTVFRFPKVVVIHLKRFSRREKLTTTVKIPTTLDMTPFAPHSDHPSKELATKYKLYAMSKHSGSLNGGHYVAEVQDTDSGKWY